MQTNDVQKLIDKILAVFAGTNFHEDLKHAKVDFFENTSVLDENSPQFDLRMSQFFDWYFFSRPLSQTRKSPLNSVDLSRELRLSDDENRILESCKNHRHSLFETVKIKKDHLIVKDLFKKEKLTIINCQWPEGFETKEIYEARLIPVDKNWILTKGLCFHPLDATDYIEKKTKEHQKNKDLDFEIFLLKLLKMRYRFERYHHVSASSIYTDSLKI